ncbi:YdcF family protein [Myxacorys almedinensis]|uniref:YdcF family protein n=1 Tax=Myxacorys almedinensis TaxID=2651157 RepID=UPI001EE3A899|nr:YdcF family protein [Myxacorys almedinensis]
MLIGWVVSIWLSLWIASSSPVDAVLVLGGSIQREIAAAQLANGSPTTPILISQGSSDPCIRSVFQQAHAPVDQVWLEKCARSTFDNVCFSLPTLRSWKVHHVKLITSESHLPRAVWLAQIVLGAHRIWVEPAIVAEPGVPGNREFGWKTGLDVARSLVWAGMSQVYSPRCSNMVRLNEVDLTAWARQGFSCERRGIPRI